MLDGEGEELGDVGLVGGSGDREPHVGGGVRGGPRSSVEWCLASSRSMASGARSGLMTSEEEVHGGD